MGRLLPPAIVLAAIIFYVATLAPGLLWGDSAKFQRMAWQEDLRFDETGHPLWVLLAHPLTRMPGLDPAGACNLLSALLSALALWPAFRIMRRLGASSASATLASLALAVSHTFWFHAVVAEVYPLNSFVTLVLLDLLTINLQSDRPGALRPASWLMMGLVFGMASGNHLQVLLWLPGYLWWMRAAWRADRMNCTAVALAAGGFVTGLAPFVILRGSAASLHGEAFSSLMPRLLSQALMPSTPTKDAAQFAGYLLYQFPLPLVLVGAAVGLIRLRRERPIDLTGLAILYATNVLFAFSYQVPDRFAFYLPSYLIIALAAAPGFDRMAGWVAATPRARAAWLLPVFAVVVVAPPLLYALA
ncbi:MAG TPA: DUF2723 domain-containing protein, partial [Patescibacteria group bacterium]|nr:DUF2723 domain-containing protein [Patescibacteria group bacterium]